MKSFKGALGQRWFLIYPGHMLLVQNEDALETSMFWGFFVYLFSRKCLFIGAGAVLEGVRPRDPHWDPCPQSFFSNIFSIFFQF